MRNNKKNLDLEILINTHISSYVEADIDSPLILLPASIFVPRPMKHSFILQLLSITLLGLNTLFCIVQLEKE